METVSCDRCGRVCTTVSSYKNHLRTCLRLPAGRTFIEEWESEPNLTMTKMARRYGVSTTAISERLNLFGLTAIERQARGRRTKGIALEEGLARRARVCSRCEIRVGVQKNGLCSYCIAEGHKPNRKRK